MKCLQINSVGIVYVVAADFNPADMMESDKKAVSTESYPCCQLMAKFKIIKT